MRDEEDPKDGRDEEHPKDRRNEEAPKNDGAAPLGRISASSPVPGALPGAPHTAKLAAFGCSRNFGSSLLAWRAHGRLGPSPRPCPRTCGQVEDVVAPAVARSHLMHADFLVAVLVVEEGAPGRPQRLHPLLHLGVAVRDLEGLAGRVLARGDALRGQGIERTKGTVRG